MNPLAARFQDPVVLPEGWFRSAFRNPSAPLLVDIGEDNLETKYVVYAAALTLTACSLIMVAL